MVFVRMCVLFVTQLLEDIMVLRVENGQDFYVTATAEYTRSCFGKPL